MNKYEILYIINNAASEEVKESLIAKLAAIVTGDGGTVEKIDKWGAKKLAYAIDDKTDGFYVLMNFESKPELVAEIDRQIHINDQFVRHMTVRI